MDLPRVDRDPAVATVMTPFPHCVDAAATLVDAAAVMRRHEVHHLPVTEGHRLIGVLRDVEVEAARATAGEAAPVRSICRNAPLVVELHETLGSVAREMARRGLDVALVVREGRLAGIFTATDALRVLAVMLRQSGGADSDTVA